MSKRIYLQSIDGVIPYLGNAHRQKAQEPVVNSPFDAFAESSR